MKVGIVLDVLNEHSGARAGIKLGQYLAGEPGLTIHFFASEKLLDEELLKSLRSRYEVSVFDKPKFISFKLRRLIRESGINVVSAHCSLRILISAFLSGVPVVRTDYGTQFPSLNGDYGLWRVGFARRLVNFAADVYVYVRDLVKFFFAAKTLSISADSSLKSSFYYGQRTSYIYLGCNGLPAPGSVRSSDSSGKVRIISVSRFVPYKGFHLLVEIFRELRSEGLPVELLLVGGQAGGKYFDFLKALVGNDPDISLKINPGDKELSELYKESDIYASCTRWEAFGLPFLEAQSLGLPVVGFSFFGPAGEIINDGETGFVVENREQFKEKLIFLVSNHAARRSLGERAELFSKQFSWSKTAAGYRRVFEEVLKK